MQKGINRDAVQKGIGSAQKAWPAAGAAAAHPQAKRG